MSPAPYSSVALPGICSSRASTSGDVVLLSSQWCLVWGHSCAAISAGELDETSVIWEMPD